MNGTWIICVNDSPYHAHIGRLGVARKKLAALRFAHFKGQPEQPCKLDPLDAFQAYLARHHWHIKTVTLTTEESS